MTKSQLPPSPFVPIEEDPQDVDGLLGAHDDGWSAELDARWKRGEVDRFGQPIAPASSPLANPFDYYTNVLAENSQALSEASSPPPTPPEIEAARVWLQRCADFPGATSEARLHAGVLLALSPTPTPAPTQLDALRALADGWETEAREFRAKAVRTEVPIVADACRVAADRLERCARTILAIIGRA